MTVTAPNLVSTEDLLGTEICQRPTLTKPGEYMHIIREYLCCVLAAAIFASLLFTACVMGLALKEGSHVLARTSRKLLLGATHLRVRWMAAGSRDA
ncbi:MAG TPA: hypothetical protein VGK99_13060 [Acidobacteriota bacterium]|jgi:hypothetical protein